MRLTIHDKYRNPFHMKRNRKIRLALFLAIVISLNFLIWNQDTYLQYSNLITYPEDTTITIRPTTFTSEFDTRLEKTLSKEDVKGVAIITPEDFNTIELPSATRDYQPFDARFTLGALLHYLDQSDIEELPGFHWADFTSMEPLEKYLFSVKMSCSDFDIRTKNQARNAKEGRMDPKSYCVDDADIPNLIETSKNEELVKNLKYIQAQKYSTGFHMFKDCLRQSFEFRPIIGRSYLYDFMPPPQSLVLLFPEFKAFQIDINKDNKLKLVQYSALSERIINVREILSKFMKTLPMQANPASQRIELSHEDFIDKSPEIIEILQNSEEPLSQRDQSYLNGLKFSKEIKIPYKHFSEARVISTQRDFSLGAHYDWRFFNGDVKGTDKNDVTLHALVKVLFKLANAYNLRCWIVHGSLLSWYWNGLRFPWDNDIDISMPIDDLHRLTRQFNQSLIVDFGNDIDSQIRYGRFFLDSTAFISRRTRENGNNNIDARLIDIDTGMYIDITGLALTDTKAPERDDYLLKATKYERDSERNIPNKSITEYDVNSFLQTYNCKNNHFFSLKEVSPLRLSLFDGEYMYVPNQVTKVLMSDFSPISLVNKKFQGYTYIPILRLWLKTHILDDFLFENAKKTNKQIKQRMRVIELNEEQCLELLKSNRDILVQYLRTKRVTEYHDNEIRKIIQGESSASLNFEDGTLIDNRAELRPDLFTWNSLNEANSYGKDWERVNNLIKEYEENGKQVVEVTLGRDVIPLEKEKPNTPGDIGKVLLQDNLRIPG
ncbi:uncharacterized protein J8A68_000888 [[Candida] subhashii]|uniref:LicD/FKTN/FKRP nucleotidyltransferase domain-containing protein n=1 Tax=[Candida] subhashii TaxID=561895 RepID=A0A8J5QRR3_9ASCO|nr:uncharacterized protein J8A68_000888 [[Candida] subhashii]KAG7665486.1 hypothetical protein J8A68_000888 [[Candida] subhashii]